MGADIKILTRQPKYPPIKDDNRVCYLLLYVCVPSRIFPPPSKRHLEGIKYIKKAGKALGVKIWPLRVTRENGRGEFRYFFRFPRYLKDDQEAQRIGECFLYALALVHGPLMVPHEAASVFRVPVEVVHNASTLTVERLVEIEEARPYNSRTLGFPHTSLYVFFSTTGKRFDAAWKITPVLRVNERLYRSVCFLKASQDDFFVWPGDIKEVISNPGLTVTTGFEQTNLENALQNAFKAIEAILGDPPKDDNRFFAKIRSIGLEPGMKIGYREKSSLHEVIRRMNEARDKKAAHGSTSYRIITINEMLEYQACARLIVWAAIESELGEQRFDVNGG